ncbi:C2H2-type zinc finger protein [Enterobacteriaceae bacterium LUAb1]
MPNSPFSPQHPDDFYNLYNEEDGWNLFPESPDFHQQLSGTSPEHASFPASPGITDTFPVSPYHFDTLSSCDSLSGLMELDAMSPLPPVLSPCTTFQDASLNRFNTVSPDTSPLGRDEQATMSPPPVLSPCTPFRQPVQQASPCYLPGPNAFAVMPLSASSSMPDNTFQQPVHVLQRSTDLTSASGSGLVPESYTCNLCNNGFPSVWSVNIHKKNKHGIAFPLKTKSHPRPLTGPVVISHSGPRCDVCNHGFPSVQSVNIHKRNKHNIALPVRTKPHKKSIPLRPLTLLPYPCDKCSSAFKTRKSLICHQNQQHKSLPERVSPFTFALPYSYAWTTLTTEERLLLGTEISCPAGFIDDSFSKRFSRTGAVKWFRRSYGHIYTVIRVSVRCSAFNFWQTVDPLPAAEAKRWRPFRNLLSDFQGSGWERMPGPDREPVSRGPIPDAAVWIDNDPHVFYQKRVL